MSAGWSLGVLPAVSLAAKAGGGGGGLARLTFLAHGTI